MEAFTLLALAPDAIWACALTRWRLIRKAQRAYILQYPGSIPDRIGRQQWLSRLGYSDGAIIMSAAYKRARPEVAVPPPEKKRGKGGSEGTKPASREGRSPAVEDGEATEPGGFRHSGPSFSELANERGKRRSSDDSLAPGFEEREDDGP
jgi:hypothetical protein